MIKRLVGWKRKGKEQRREIDLHTKEAKGDDDTLVQTSLTLECPYLMMGSAHLNHSESEVHVVSI